jgi:choline-sulfatase
LLKPRVVLELLCLAGLVLACRGTDPAPRARVPLSAFAGALREITTAADIDIGTPAGRERLREGWGPDEANADTTFSWGAGPLSRLIFDADATDDLDLALRGWSFPFADDAPQRVEVRLNGRPIGDATVPRTATTLRFKLAADRLRAGENLLELRYERWHDAPGEAPWAVAWDGLRLNGKASGESGARRPAVEAVGGSVTLPAGSGIEAVLELPPGTALAWEKAVVTGGVQLSLAVEGEGDRETHFALRPGANGSRRIAGDAPGTRLVRFLLSASGRGGEARLTGLHLQQFAPSGEIAGPAPSPSSTATPPLDEPHLRPNLIVYLIDTLRADHLGCYGYARPTSPRIDRFAGESIRFANGRAQSSWTKPAVASILTGLFPPAHGAQLRSQKIHESVETLAERLQKLGYETALFTTNANIVARFGFDQGWDSFRYLAHRSGRKHQHFDADEMNREVFSWLDQRSQRPQTRPFFLVVHTLDPHDPYRPREEFRSRLAPQASVEQSCCLRTSRLAELSASAARDHAAQAIALYDAEIAQNDAAFGELLDELERRNLAATSAILLTADHGEEFFDHGGWKHGFTLYEEVLRIPFILRLPAAGNADSRGRTIAAAVDQVDIAPTLLALAGAAPAPDLPGRDLLPWVTSATPPAPSARTSFAWLSRPGAVSTAMLAGDWKLIRSPEGRDGPAWADDSAAAPPTVGVRFRELYDLASDPGERQSLLDPSLPRTLRELWLEGEMSASQKLHGDGEPAEEAEIDPELEKSLRALGYF